MHHGTLCVCVQRYFERERDKSPSLHVAKKLDPSEKSWSRLDSQLLESPGSETGTGSNFNPPPQGCLQISMHTTLLFSYMRTLAIHSYAK